MSGIPNHLRSRAALWSLAMLLALLFSAVHGVVRADDGGQTYPPRWVPAPGAYPPPPPGFAPMVGPQHPAAAPGAPIQRQPAARPREAVAAGAPAVAEAMAAADDSAPSATTVAEPPAPPQPPAAPAVADPSAGPAYPEVASNADSGRAQAGAEAAAAQVADAGSNIDGGKAAGISSGDSPECMRCHWMETMAYRDRETREIVNLSIDREAYQHSVHNELACRDCHDRGYKHYPHRTSSADEGLQCVECHAQRQDDEAYQPPKLDGFDIQYHDSVHAEQDEEPFSCFSCHNPHEFRPLPNDTPVPQVVAANNNLCLDCHTELRSPVPKGHDWLPQPQRHWASVRCIDCHTPVEGRDLYAPSHQLLGAEDSNQNCVECHSQGGQLLAQLYVHRAEQERDQEGFFSHAIYNDAYIIGMSRSPLIDLIGLAIVGLMIIGIAAHGYGRYLAHKRAHKPEREAQ